MSLEAISPNQFALPGMEGQSHRLARHVAAGVLFKFNSSVQNVARPDMDDPKGPAYRPPLSFDPPVGEHTLSARQASNPAHVLGDVNWHGNNESTMYHPGEVTWVERKAGAYEGGDTDKPMHPGIMGDMFHAGHEIDMGQQTRPIHSTERTAFGNPWAKKVGPPELVPRKGGNPVVTPPGFHPFERAGSPRQLAPAMEGQGELLPWEAGRRQFEETF